MKMKVKIFAGFAVALLATGLLFANRAFAAQFVFEPPNSVNIGVPFELPVKVKTNGQALNAISGEISFPSDLLSVKSINEGNSMLNLWVEAPRLEKNKIVFSGITPGGYFSEEGLIFSVSFVPQKTGAGEVLLEQMVALLNDGMGTATTAETAPWPFVVLSSGPAASAPFIAQDTVPPELFTPEISQTPDVYDNAYFLAFLTQDKGSGIDHYEVAEARSGQISPRVWQNAVSPYRLKDQELKSHIWVKAVDKAGNVRIAQLSPAQPMAWYEYQIIFAIIIAIAVLVLLFFICRSLWKIRRK